MYFGQKEIKNIESDHVVFMDDTTLSISETDRELFTDEPMDGGKLQRFWQLSVAKKLYDVLIENNVRINDIHAMLQCVEEILGDKLNEQMVNTVWKQKLDVFAQVFGASEEVVMPLSHRAIRTQDLFKS